jgi:hypothetical protein
MLIKRSKELNSLKLGCLLCHVAEYLPLDTLSNLSLSEFLAESETFAPPYLHALRPFSS